MRGSIGVRSNNLEMKYIATVPARKPDTVAQALTKRIAATLRPCITLFL
jgi:hypothetical protein